MSKVEEELEIEYGNLTVYEGIHCISCDSLLGYSKDVLECICLCEKCMNDLETAQRNKENVN